MGEESTATLSFLEKPNGYSTGFAAALPPESYADATPNVGLAEYMSRPVKVNSYTWNESDPIGNAITFNPWQLFFNDPVIQNKLYSYAWLKCDLKIKVMVNASPFYYGATLMSYQPLPNFHDGGIVNDSGTRYFIPYSQRPHLWLYPQNNEGGEMTLPFMFQKNWISTNSKQDFLDMGAITTQVVYPLSSANGVTTSGVTVTTYAWAENVVLSGPTVGLTQQSDEYGKGQVSSMASAIAATMKSLSNVPIIGKYATATQLGAQAVAEVASNLGFSNPPVIDDIKPLKPTPVPPLASAEISYPIEKLTIDPKNELSVDPSLLGLPGHDELSLQNIVTKESYLTQFPWTTSTTADTLLFNTAITPMMFDIDSSTQRQLYQTPMCWAGQMFQYWRGDIIIRLRFICSQYHRGRVRIIYDPSASLAQNILSVTDTQTSCFNEVIDLTKDTNVEIRVPYNQALPWCQTFVPTAASQIPFTVGSGTVFNHVPGTTNGILAVRCVTALSAPIASSTISCIVSVRGAENLEFAAPSDIQSRYSYFVPQSDEYEETDSVSIIAGHAPSVPAPGRFLINHGEQIVSLRQLLRRFSYSRTFVSDSSSAGTAIRSVVETFNRFPLSPGYDPTGIHLAAPLVGAINKPYNFVGQTYLNWISPAFLGYRGSINYVINFDCPNPIKNATVARTYIKSVYNTVLNVGTVNLLSNGANSRYYANTINMATCGGASLTNQLTNGSLSFQAPMYSAFKINTTTPRNASASIAQDDTNYQMLRLNYSVENPQASLPKVHYYVAAGTDFNLYFFLNVPTVFLYTVIPAAI